MGDDWLPIQSHFFKAMCCSSCTCSRALQQPHAIRTHSKAPTFKHFPMTLSPLIMSGGTKFKRTQRLQRSSISHGFVTTDDERWFLNSCVLIPLVRFQIEGVYPVR